MTSKLQNQKITIFLLLTILAILSLPAVFGTAEYFYPNQYDGYAGTGRFSSSIDLDEVDINLRSIDTNAVMMPLTGDLDSDGVNEIIIIDDDNVEIYQTKDLNIITGQSAEDTIEHAVLYDIDLDGDEEVITVGGDKASIFDFNGSVLSLTSNFTIPDLEGSKFMIGCGGAAGECLIVNARFKSGVPSTESVRASRMNTTGIYNSTSLKSSVNNGDFYLPKIRTVEVKDGDTDGTSEYYFSVYDNGNLQVVIFRVSASASIGVVEEKELTISASIVNSDRDEFTSPLVFDFDPGTSGTEIVIAYQADSVNEYEMVLLDEDGNEIQDYPDLTYADGVIISNPVRTSVFTDSGNTDYCVLGYDTGNDEINLLCGSKITGEDIIPGEVFSYDGAIYYDITDNADLYNNMLASVQVSASTTDGENLNEFMTTFGVFSIDYDLVNELILEYDVTLDQGAFLWSDFESTGYADIVYLTDDAVYYIDDGFENSQVSIDSYTVNAGDPFCLDRTYTITVTVTDTENDDAVCHIDEYYLNGTFITSTANKTTTTPGSVNLYYTADEQGDFLLTINCTDGINTVADTEDVQRSVSNDTDVCYAPGENPETVTPGSSEEAAEDEDFQADAAQVFADIGIESSLGLTIIWLIIMMIVAFIVIGKVGHSQSVYVLLSFIEIMMLLIGYYIGFIGMIPLVMIGLLAALFLSLSLIRMSGGNGG